MELSKKIQRFNDKRKLIKETVKATTFICLVALLGKRAIRIAPKTGKQSKERRIFSIKTICFLCVCALCVRKQFYLSANQKKLKSKINKSLPSKKDARLVVATTRKANKMVKLRNIIKAYW